MQSSLVQLIVLMRPHQYVKNLFIFLPLFFAGEITDISLDLRALVAFIAFSICASAVYILNDLRDVEADRQHPRKMHRPLASGAVSTRSAVILMLVLVIAGFILMETLSREAAEILAAYVVMNIAYSFYLKHVAILDIMVIAIGFVLRLSIGSTVNHVPLSMWIVIMTFLLALFLALAKRRDDILIYEETGKAMRKVVDGYSLQFVDIAMSIMASVVVVAYILYTTSAEVMTRLHSENLYLTVLFVIMGILRYMQIVFVQKDSGSPTRIVLKDRFMHLVILGWLLMFSWILY